MQPIYVVLLINLIVWIGIFGFLFSTDLKVKKISEKLERLATKNE